MTTTSVVLLADGEMMYRLLRPSASFTISECSLSLAMFSSVSQFLGSRMEESPIVERFESKADTRLDQQVLTDILAQCGDGNGPGDQVTNCALSVN